MSPDFAPVQRRPIKRWLRRRPGANGGAGRGRTSRGEYLFAAREDFFPQVRPGSADLDPQLSVFTAPQRLHLVPIMKIKSVRSTVSLFCLLAVAPLALAQTKEPPVPVRTVPPDYPNELRREGVSGIVTVKCTIDEQGNVQEPEVEKSTNGAFDKPAIAALKKWKFKPAKQDGAPVSIKVSIPIKFVFES